MYDEVTNQLENWLTTSLVPNVSTVISGLSSGLLSVVLALKNILIGVIVMVYLLNIKETLSAQERRSSTVCCLCGWRISLSKSSALFTGCSADLSRASFWIP